MALVIYEPDGGQTRRLARAVADGLSDRATVGLLELSQAPTWIGTSVDLLVAGVARSDDAEFMCTGKERTIWGDEVSRARVLADWLDHLHPMSPELAVAAFDTSAPPTWPAYAATAVGRLRALGLRVIAPPETFHVSDDTGLLGFGEEVRARSWGGTLWAGVARGLSDPAWRRPTASAVLSSSSGLPDPGPAIWRHRTGRPPGGYRSTRCAAPHAAP